MTEIADMLEALKRIETKLASIEALLADVFEKPKIIRESVSLNERLRDRLRRLRHTPGDANEP